MLTGLIIAVLLAALAALLPFVRAGWQRLISREGDLQMWRTMRRVGVAPEEVAGQEAKMGHAVRRCVMCPSIEECQDWLESGSREGLGGFCPNAGFFAQLKAAKDQPKR